jgi:hypothetical protein
MKDQDEYKQFCDTIKADKDAKREERELMLDDQRFAAGDQWPTVIKRKREIEGRPIQTINRIPAFIDQVVGDARQNKPSIKVHAGEDGDEDIAAIYDGLIRSIQNESNADFAYDTAVEHTACFGFGAWRVKTDYESEDSFNQVVCIERITDPLSVYFDKNSVLPDYSDARHVTVRVKLTKDEYKQRWPKAEESDYNFDDFTGDWIVDKDQVIVAEYWHKVDEKATLYAVEDFEGNTQVTLEKPPIGYNVVNQRETTITKIKMCMISGAGILEESDWAGKYLPIVGVNGKEDLVDGKRTLRGLVRFAKDPQRMYNYWRTIDTEQKALAPKAPVLVTAKQIEGYEQHWQESLTTNMPYLIVNDVPSASMPQRINAGIVDKGANEAALMCVDEMKSTTGIFSASLGEQDNEKSGRAILAQQRKGDTANFAYIDNIARAIKWTGKIIIDLIPKIYDAARVVAVMGADGEKKLQRINQVVMQKGEPKNMDLSVGKYDLVVTQGASYATKRIEALNSMVEIARVNPAIMQIAGDLIVKAMDWDGASEIAERMKKMLPPQLQENEDENGEQKQLPPEVQAMIEQGKQQIDELTKQVQMLEDEKDDKDDELRLKKYEIDVKAEIELAKLAKEAGIGQEQIIALVNQVLMNAAQQPELPDDDIEQQPPMPDEMMMQQMMQEQPMIDEQQMPVDLSQGVDVEQFANLPDVDNGEQLA